jgi:O-antigen ligase
MNITAPSFLQSENKSYYWFGFVALAIILVAIYSEQLPLVILPFLIFPVTILFFFPRFLPHLFVFLFPFGWPNIELAFNIDLFPADAVLACIALAVFTTGIPLFLKPLKWFIPKYILLFFVILSSLLINIPWISDKAFLHSVWYLAEFLKLGFIFWLGVYCGQNESMRRNLLNTFLIASIIPGIVELVQVFVIKAPSTLLWGAIGTNGQHHSGMGVFLCLPFFFTLGRMLRDHKLFSKYFLLLLWLVLALLLTQSRSMLIGIILVAPVMLYMNWRKIGIRNIIFLILAVFILVQFSGQAERVISRTFAHNSKEVDYSSLSRLVIWKSTIKAYAHLATIRKLFGCGIGNLAYAVELIFPIDAGSKHPSGAHNNYLQVLMETGIIGLSIFLYLLVGLCWRLWKAARKDDEIMAFFLLTLVMVIGALVQEFFWMASWHAYALAAYLFFLGTLSWKIFGVNINRNGRKNILTQFADPSPY